MIWVYLQVGKYDLFGGSMKIKNKYAKLLVAVSSFLVVVSLTSALYIEKFFSKRIKYKKPDFILSERKKMVEQYGAQPVSVTTADNHKIAALYIGRPGAQRIFLICHGFKHSKEYMAGFLELFPDDSIVFIDLRGHGQSDGERVSLGLSEYLDVVAVVDYIKKNISSTLPLYGLGISLGGSAVLRAAAAGAPFDAVISDSAPVHSKTR